MGIGEPPLCPVLAGLQAKAREVLLGGGRGVDLREVLERHEPEARSTGRMPSKPFFKALKGAGLVLTPEEKEAVLRRFANFRGMVNYAR